MSILSDRDILAAVRDGDILIDPFDPWRVQPCSIDLTLDSQYRVPDPGVTRIDLADVPVGHTRLLTADPDDGIVLRPGAALLGCTAEAVGVSEGIAARVEGKSSLGRLLVAVHVSAGYVDAGFGHPVPRQITLEIVNLGPWEIVLRPGEPMCQLSFEPLTSPASRPYSVTGRYSGQVGPTESRYGHARIAAPAVQGAAALVGDDAVVPSFIPF